MRYVKVLCTDRLRFLSHLCVSAPCCPEFPEVSSIWFRDYVTWFMCGTCEVAIAFRHMVILKIVEINLLIPDEIPVC